MGSAITLDVSAVRGRAASRPRRADGRGLVPFVMATPHRASAAAARAQFLDAETTEAILDVETAFIKDVWTDHNLRTQTAAKRVSLCNGQHRYHWTGQLPRNEALGPTHDA